MSQQIIEQKIREAYQYEIGKLTDPEQKFTNSYARYLVAEVLGWVSSAIKIGMYDLIPADLQTAIDLFNELSGLRVSYEEDQGFITPNPEEV